MEPGGVYLRRASCLLPRILGFLQQGSVNYIDPAFFRITCGYSSFFLACASIAVPMATPTPAPMAIPTAILFIVIPITRPISMPRTSPSAILPLFFSSGVFSIWFVILRISLQRFFISAANKTAGGTRCARTRHACGRCGPFSTSFMAALFPSQPARNAIRVLGIIREFQHPGPPNRQNRLAIRQPRMRWRSPVFPIQYGNPW
jgi:hypothetical protein